MSQLTPARKLFDLLVSRDFDPEMLDVAGKPAPDPSEAEIFSFDFRAESGKDYGTVVVMLTNEGDMEVYYADNVGKTMEGNDKTDWFNFLEQLKNFAVRNNRMNFGLKNLNHLRYSMQGQAAIQEGLFESWAGRKDVSYNAGPTESRLMIKHKRNLGEDEARFRYVESLFIETAEGERYKLPFKNLTAGKAMLEHVRMGGRPYDSRGQHIAEMITELTVLSRFRRANHGRLLEGDTAQLVEQTNAYYETLQHNLKSLTSPRGYAAYFESWVPTDVTEESVVIEGLKHLFVTQSIDQRIEDALPLIARIQQQGTAMKEANIFEAWAERLVEGTWQLPDTPEKQKQLVELMSQDLPVGADATNVTEQLYDLLGDDHLFDQLQELAEQDANADARQVIYDRMQMLSDHPDVLRVIEQLQIDPTAEMNPNEATPADLSDEPPEQSNQVPGATGPVTKLAEDALKSLRRSAGLLESRMLDEDGSTLEHILNRFKYEVREFEQGGDLDKHLYHALEDYYRDLGEIPYPILTGNEGDPMEWVAQNLESHLRGGGIVNGTDWGAEDRGLERESVMHGDYAEEREPHTVDGGMDNPLIQDEGILGTLGGAAAGMALGGPVGAAIGAVGGQELTKGGSSIIEDDKEKKSSSSVLPAVAAGVAGAGLGYMAGKASGGSSTPPSGSETTSTSSSLTGSDKYGSWENPGQISPPTATGSGLGINPPAAGSMGDIAASAILEKETDEDGAPMMGMSPLAQAAGATMKDAIVGEDDMEEGELGTAVGAGLGGAVGGIGGAALGGLAGHYLTKDKEVKKESDDLNRMSDLAGIKKKVADESLLAPLVGAVGGAALGGELASGIGSKFGSEVGGSIGQAAGQEQAGKLGAFVGGMKGSSAGAAAGGAAAKTAGQVAGGIAGLAGGAALDQAKKSNDDNTEETDEGWKGQLAGGTLGSIGGGLAGSALGGPIGAMIGSALGGTAGSMAGNKLGGPEETDEGIRGALAGGALGGAATRSVKGAVAGAKLGSAIQDRFAKKDTSPLAGQYGHSGKMKEVGKDTSFLDRLKELSGMKQN